jgi:hypothetical protein
MAKNEHAERVQAFLKIRQAVLAGELTDKAAITVMVEAGWTEEKARFHVEAWQTLSTLRLMQGERKSSVRVLQVTNLDDMLWLLTAGLDGKGGET